MKQPLGDTSEQKTLTSDGKKKLTRLVAACYEALNVFGKSPEQLESITMIMQMTLAKYDYEIIRKAFEIHLTQSSIMPTPADIIKIISPPIPAKKWCASSFIDIKRRWREGQFIMDEEKKYCSDFVAAQIKAPEAERSLIEETIRQVESENRKYLEIYD